MATAGPPAELARLARERGCGRFEWSVLEWNEPAIAFYRSLGARMLEDWRILRVTGDALEELSRGGGGRRPAGDREATGGGGASVRAWRCARRRPRA